MKLVRWILDRPTHTIALAIIVFAITTLAGLWGGHA